jgi:RNA polymerase sigma factor (sigma-70 family)
MARTAETTIVDEHGIMINWALRKLQVPTESRADGYQGGAVGLLKAADRFDAEKGSFRSFAGAHVLEEVRRAVGWKRRTRMNLVSLDALNEGEGPSRLGSAGRKPQRKSVDWDDPVFSEVARAETIAAVAAFVATLDEDDRYLYRRLYAEGATQTAVALELGTNKMAISRRVARLHAQASLVLAVHAPAA